MLSRLFRRLVLTALHEAFEDGQLRFAGPQQVLDYVGRYTHRVAIANQRLIDIDDRHYGLLGNRHRRHHLVRCRQLLGTTVAPPIARETRPADYRDRYEMLTGVSLRACPVCPDGHMIRTEGLRRARPHPAGADTS